MNALTTGPGDPDCLEESCESSVDTELMVRMRMTEENVYQLIVLIDQRSEKGFDDVIRRDELSQPALNTLLEGIQVSPICNEEAERRLHDACLVLSEISEVISKKTFDLDSKENIGNLSHVLYFLDRSRALVYESVLVMERGAEINVYLFDLALAKVRDRVNSLLD